MIFNYSYKSSDSISGWEKQASNLLTLNKQVPMIIGSSNITLFNLQKLTFGDHSILIMLTRIRGCEFD